MSGSANAAWVLPLHTMIRDKEDCCPAWRVEVRDLARGFAGALFVSLPLLYTQEMWDFGRGLRPGSILAFLGAAFLICYGMILFAGFRKVNWQRSAAWDALACLGIGAIASLLTLLVAGIIDGSTPVGLAGRLVALETVATSIGAAVASNQLGSGDSALRDRKVRRSDDETVVLGSLLGGILFALNIAPTMETKFVATQQDWVLALATFLLSVAVAFIIVNIAQFEERDLSRRKIITSTWLEALVAYLIAFAVSWWLLWMFAYITLGDPLEEWLPQVITLAYCTSLGGAAGRIVL